MIIKFLKKFIIGIGISLLFNACQTSGNLEELTTRTDSISYYSGVFTAWTVKDFEVNEFNTDAFRAGMDKVFGAEDPGITLADADFNIGWYFEKLRALQDQRNENEGREFLQKNKLKDGVMTSSSGLQYANLKTGNGQRAKLNELVVVNYRGTLIDGTVFTEAYSDTIRINEEEMIDGWIEALQMMRADSKIKIFLSPELAFGSGENSFLKSNMTVIYDIELTKIITDL